MNKTKLLDMIDKLIAKIDKEWRKGELNVHLIEDLESIRETVLRSEITYARDKLPEGVPQV